MDPWQEWWRMAQGSLIGAQILEVEGESRSSASRAYYASYQAATALLLYARQIPPEGREAWGHDATPELLRNLTSKILTSVVRQGFMRRLKILYELRINADYHGGIQIDPRTLQEALKSAVFMIKLVDGILPGG